MGGVYSSFSLTKGGCKVSHTMNIKMEIKDLSSLVKAAYRCGASVGCSTKTGLFDGSVIEGVPVKLPGWVYPVIVDTKTGACSFDNYNGHWGSMSELNKLKGFYGVEVAKKAARMKGYRVKEVVKDNRIELVVMVGGA
jgi:hypothetical protein